MKHFFLYAATMAIIFASCSKDKDTDPFDETTISMGTGSSEDVYFSFAQGEVKHVTRNTWDLAFSTPVQTATIRINEGSGAELYCVGDTTEWDAYSSFDPGDYHELLNDKSDWSVGAFNVNQDVANPFNFGWGTYKMTDHNVYGDSLYVIRLTGGSYKKMMIRKKIGATDVYHLKWANVDGTEQVETSFSCAPYADTKHFIHYSIANGEIVEAEPGLAEWDLVFTRYNILIPAGPATLMKYTVTGILSNPDVVTAKVTDLPPVSAVPADAPVGFLGEADIIGSDWKVSDPVTHEISLTDSLSYFVQSVDGNTYQLYFSGYGGLEQGTITIRTRRAD